MSQLDHAAAAVVAAKQKEQEAIAARHAAELVLLHLVESKAEGSVMAKGDAYKATVTYAVNRTIDAAALEAVRAELSPALFEQAIEYAPKLRLAGVRYLQNKEPQAYAVLAQAITAKPAKPSVKVELIEATQAQAA